MTGGLTAEEAPHVQGAQRRSADIACPTPPRGSDADRAVKQAGLVFSADCSPGIRRMRDGDGNVVYRRDGGGHVLKRDLARIEALKIPPAWSDVWICADDLGHLQATGRDARGRKQYRYHDAWRSARDATKFDRLVEFGEALPGIRSAVDRDLARPAVDRRRVLALVVAVLDNAVVRVGSPRYVRSNESFGLTTLRDEHVDVGTTRVRMRYRGKAGKEISVSIDDPRIARAVRRVRDLPGQELFQYVDGRGDIRTVDSGDVNAYLREHAKMNVTSKDFRTWGGSLALAEALHRTGGPPSERAVAEAVKAAAAVLGNTPAVCRRSYIHPGLIELYLSGGFEEAWAHAEQHEPRRRHMSETERAFLGLLRHVR